jgi:C4-type Zn-finger protein
MAIDFDKETPVYVIDVPNLPFIPRRRNGRAVTSATVYGWIRKGVMGVQLESASIGGAIATTEGAVQRFFDAVQKRQGSRDEMLRRIECEYAARVKELAAKAAERAATEAAAARRR